jgi:hypothetical protein
MSRLSSFAPLFLHIPFNERKRLTLAALTVRRTGAPEYNKIKMLLAGAPGSGKTLLSSTFPNAIYASAEGGLMSIADRNIPFVEIASIDQLYALKVMLDQEEKVRTDTFGFPIDTVVVDTIDEIQRIMVRERLEETRKDSMALQDYGWMKEQMTALIRGFRNITNLNVVFCVHLSDKTDSVTGKMFVRPGLQGAIGDEIPAYVDLALVLRSVSRVEVVEGQAQKVTQRILQSVPDDLYDWVKDRSGKLPPEILVNFTDDYERIYDCVFSSLGSLPTQTEFSIGQDPDEPPDIEEVRQLVEERAEAVRKRSRPSKQPEPELGTLLDQPVQRPEVSVPLPETTESEPAPKPQVEKAEPAPVTTEAEFGICEVCGTPLENSDQYDLSKIRYRQVLCREHFIARRNK